MKRQDVQKYRDMDAKKLMARADELKKDIAGLLLERQSGKMKDTNNIAKKKKELAVVLTFLRAAQS